jgi:hypothetical protein
MLILQVVSLVVALHASGVESRQQNTRNLRYRYYYYDGYQYPYGHPPPPPPPGAGTGSGRWQWVGPSHEPDTEQEEVITADPQPEYVEEPSSVASEPIEDPIVEEPAVEEPVVEEHVDPEPAVEELISEPAAEDIVDEIDAIPAEETDSTSAYNSQVNAGSAMVAESTNEEGTGPPVGAIVGIAAAVAALVAIAIIALGRRNKKDDKTAKNGEVSRWRLVQRFHLIVLISMRRRMYHHLHLLYQKKILL